MKPDATKHLIMVAGPPGSGKTFLIRDLQRRVLLEYISTDVIWQALFPNPEYSPQESHMVFGYLAATAERKLAESAIPVLIEGVFASEERVDILKRRTACAGANLHVVVLWCDRRVAAGRMRRRTEQPAVPEKRWHELTAKLERWSRVEPNSIHIRTNTLKSGDVATQVFAQMPFLRKSEE